MKILDHVQILDQRREIDASKCVVWFNDVKKYREGERVDIGVISSHIASDSSVSRFPGEAKIAFVKRREGFVPPSSSNGRVIGMVEAYDVNDNGGEGERLLFQGCSKERRQGDAPHGGSTGGVVLSSLQGEESIKKIHVYGMNWNGPPDHHVDFSDSSLVQTCCTKCIFHTTPSKNYI